MDLGFFFFCYTRLELQRISLLSHHEIDESIFFSHFSVLPHPQYYKRNLLIEKDMFNSFVSYHILASCVIGRVISFIPVVFALTLKMSSTEGT